ncbi:gamma-glutamyltransferase [Cellulomonas sp. zg-ZUI199]|uniref:Glutathione hydrolase proenzyme n=1 Tax=Cellulomonas wangleii TaxID=2816956 RepID=A0ABX8D712_9CELL|nr:MULTISPECIES: gamma-glutamyltransferase [Cellulomonas]MBO0898744.1 gamma-glutamyltransferase [Cellulomonas sp. zg-ZUI22]MBO0923968.1 gamma-glutamyltransferase [Cellulomonas wangleii]MBO0924250.1 gamma-glutamyltransferase [Cellulomonas wangleii]QVI62261.1 gamma-glutamyltransferase [Cellulomonas wangleii]
MRTSTLARPLVVAAASLALAAGALPAAAAPPDPGSTSEGAVADVGGDEVDGDQVDGAQVDGRGRPGRPGKPGPGKPGPHRPPAKVPVAVGSGGAVATVDPDATRVGLEVLRRGGNAVDAAVAAAATLGVTEPYSAGIGGGGFLVVHDAATGTVQTLDGRETAPAAMGPDAFVENGTAIPFDQAVTSGLSVGVPGTPATWQAALDTWGTLSLRDALAGATRVAEKGFVVDRTFVEQTAANADRFAAFPSTAALYLPGGAPPRVGSVLRNPDLARTYRLLARDGVDALYTGPLAQEIVDTVQAPPVAPGSTRVVRPGLLETSDLAAYDVVPRDPTHVTYRGLDVYGMAPPSSGGSTVGEALNILETVDLGALDDTQALHRYIEASSLAFADRNRYVGDPAFVDVPLEELLSDGFAAERACLIDPTAALPKPIAPGVPDGTYEGCEAGTDPGVESPEGTSTTHLTTADRWGNVVAYTLTIESTGGNGIVVPGRGFLLNNELTDFSFTDTQGGSDPNLPGPGKRPRSSMAPTIVLRDGRPFLALGSPGGATIITTVLQTLVNRIDLGMPLDQAVAAPRATPRNGTSIQAEPGFPRTGLEALGHTFADTPEIGAATAIEVLDGGRLLSVAEPVRRGGGSAGVVRPQG